MNESEDRRPAGPLQALLSEFGFFLVRYRWWWITPILVVLAILVLLLLWSTVPREDPQILAMRWPSR